MISGRIDLKSESAPESKKQSMMPSGIVLVQVALMSGSVSPLAPKTFTAMPALRGVRMTTASAGIKYKNRTDVLLMVFDKPAAVAGVFTRSKCPSAPVDFCRAALKNGEGHARALIVNSGNANAFTGKVGAAACKTSVEAAARIAGTDVNHVYVSSTGVIGEPLPADKLVAALPKKTGETSPRSILPWSSSSPAPSSSSISSRSFV